MVATEVVEMADAGSEPGGDSSEEEASEETKARWTKNDSVRLIELVRSEQARPLLIKAGDILSRAELDNRKNAEDPWSGV